MYAFEFGMTVKELKKIIQDWPEEDELGEPTEVWIETGRELSSAVTFVSLLNRADLLLESDAFEEILY